jgi:hypothetical protein
MIEEGNSAKFSRIVLTVFRIASSHRQRLAEWISLPIRAPLEISPSSGAHPHSVRPAQPFALTYGESSDEAERELFENELA